MTSFNRAALFAKVHGFMHDNSVSQSVHTPRINIPMTFFYFFVIEPWHVTHQHYYLFIQMYTKGSHFLHYFQMNKFPRDFISTMYSIPQSYNLFLPPYFTFAVWVETLYWDVVDAIDSHIRCIEIPHVVCYYKYNTLITFSYQYLVLIANATHDTDV